MLSSQLIAPNHHVKTEFYLSGASLSHSYVRAGPSLSTFIAMRLLIFERPLPLALFQWLLDSKLIC